MIFWYSTAGRAASTWKLSAHLVPNAVLSQLSCLFYKSTRSVVSVWQCFKHHRYSYRRLTGPVDREWLEEVSAKCLASRCASLRKGTKTEDPLKTEVGLSSVSWPSRLSSSLAFLFWIEQRNDERTQSGFRFGGIGRGGGQHTPLLFSSRLPSKLRF